MRSFGRKGLVLQFSESVRRTAPCPRSCQPVMCALPCYAVRLYIPVSAVIPPVVMSHTLIRHELLFRSCYHRQGPNFSVRSHSIFQAIGARQWP